MNTPINTPYRVVEIERTQGQGLGEVILFGLLAAPPATTLSTPQTPTPIFCLCFGKGGWEFIVDDHYDPETVQKVLGNGTRMGLNDLITLARTHATAKYPKG